MLQMGIYFFNIEKEVSIALFSEKGKDSEYDFKSKEGKGEKELFVFTVV